MLVFIGLVILILLVYALIIRPLTQNGYRRNSDPYWRDSGRDGYGRFSGGYGNGYGGTFGAGLGNSFGGGFGRSGFGMMAGGFAAGALLTWLLEQGRIDAAQYDYFQGMDQQRMIDELLSQNILQQHEIDELMNRDGLNGPDDRSYDAMDYDDRDRNFDNDPYDPGYDDDFNGPDGGDNWV